AAREAVRQKQARRHRSRLAWSEAAASATAVAAIGRRVKACRSGRSLRLLPVRATSPGAQQQEEAADPSPSRFDELPLSAEGKLAMREGFRYEYQTEVQAKTFRPIAQGSDLVVRAKTGSGKTLSFLLPVMDTIFRCTDGSAAPATIEVLIVSPVRELSMQISQEAEKLAQYYPGIQSVCMTGGVPWQEDVKALDSAGADKAVCLIVTPGRLQTHLSKTPGFAERIAREVRTLVLDEVDELAGELFRPTMEEIMSALPPPSSRQSLFYSATMSEEVVQLVKKAAKPEYTYLDLLQGAAISVPDQIEQTYRVVPTEDVTLALWQAVQAAQAQDDGKPKIVIIFMTGRIAAYYAEAFRKSGSASDVFEIHARKSQKQRTAQSESFRAALSGVLFTSDVSSRGLDYPGVTQVVQVGAPHSKDEYIHRLGRTGRAGNSGRGLLLLHDFEARSFLAELADLPLVEVKLDSDSAGASELPDFISMDIPQNVKAQAYYSRINHVMRNAGDSGVLEILREAKRFAASIGALDQDGQPPAITEANAVKMGVADISDPALYIVPTPIDPRSP
ncbi:unnamed protein product, partial [Polarella glacialis]